MNGFTRSALEAQATAGLRALLELVGADPDAPHLEAGPLNYIAEVQRLASRPPLNLERLLRAEPAGHVDVGTLMPRALEALECGVAEIPVPMVDTADPVMAGPVPWSALCRSHLMPFGGVSWVCHDPGPAGYRPAPFAPEEIMRRRALGWRVPARALAVAAGHLAGGITSPELVAVDTARALSGHLGGAGAVCRVRVTRPCPARHDDARTDATRTVMHGEGVYAGPEYTPDGEVTTNEKRRDAFMAFVRSGTVQGVTSDMVDAAAAVAGYTV